jgi:hypothetical protein
LRRGPSRVDRDNNVIYGATLIQAGPLNDGDSRPWFIDDVSLSQVLSLVGLDSPRGTKARWTHPNMSSDGLGKYLGRWRNPRMSSDGQSVLADLHLANVADYDGRREYVLTMAAEHPDAFGVSLFPVLDRAEMERLQTADGKQPMRFKRIIAGDVVDEPAATRGGFFGGQELSIASAPAYAAAALDALFADATPDVIRARASAFLESYLAQRKPASGGAVTLSAAELQAAVAAGVDSAVEQMADRVMDSLNPSFGAFENALRARYPQHYSKGEDMTTTLATPLTGDIELAAFTGDEAASFESVREYANDYLSHVAIHADARLDLASYVCGRLKDDGRPVTPAMASALAKQSAIVESHHPMLTAESWKVSGLKD